MRLPLDDAARLAALAEMFPGRSSEQLITELLGTALEELAAAMPYVAGTRVISTDEQGDPIYEDMGLTPRFMQLARSTAASSKTAADAPGPRRRRAQGQPAPQGAQGRRTAPSRPLSRPVPCPPSTRSPSSTLTRSPTRSTRRTASSPAL